MNNSIKENINLLKQTFSESADLTVREMELNSKSKTSCAVVTIDGLSDKNEITLSVTNPLLSYNFRNSEPSKIFDEVITNVLFSCDNIEFNSFSEIIQYITKGFAVLLIDGCERFIAIGTQGYSYRSISEPDSEVVQRGSREGFTEPLRVNMSLIRRRIKSPDLVFETLTVGETSQTELMLCYLQDSVDYNMLEEVRSRLQACKIDTVLAAGYLSEYLEDENSGLLFSGVGISERPDTVCGKLTEGRIAVIVDGTPAVLIVPHLFVEEFQGIDDYSNRVYYASFIRILKYLSFFISVCLPGLYTALAQFHPEYFPTWILIQTSESLAKTPLPVTIEVLFITFVYEIMKEAGLRIPKSLGHAVSIVGALVIGDSAVNAGIISASTLMVVATAAICSYVISSLYPPITMLRFAYIIVGGTLGLWGIVLLTAVIIINVCSKTSLGVPYMSSISPFSLKRMRDVFIRASWKKLDDYTIRVDKFRETEDL